MTTPGTLALAERVAYELDGWEAQPCRYGNLDWFELLGPAGDVIQLRIGPCWVDAHGVHEQELGRTRHWNVAGYRRAEIGFSAAKTPARMAAEIRRRLLPTVAENNRLLDAEAALIASEDAADDALFAAAKAVFPGLQWWNNGSERRDKAVAYSHGGGIGIKFRLDPFRYNVHSSLNVSNLARAELLELIRAVARVRTPAAARRGESQSASARRPARRRTGNRARTRVRRRAAR